MYTNPIPTRLNVDGAMWDALKRYARRPKGTGKPSDPITVQPITAADLFAPASQVPRIWWLGHASVLLEMGGQRYLLDPVLSERASFSQSIGPRRLHASPIHPSDIPYVDAVVLSHDHYDHMDKWTIRMVAERTRQFIVPMGLGTILRRWGVPAERIMERNWWQDIQHGDNTIVCTPARHYSGRTLSTRMTSTYATLWASWCFINGNHRVYFGGDSGFMPQYDDIGKAFGPFDLTLMPIGAYDKAWAEIHLFPEEAIAAHGMVGGELLLPIHWATFDLAIHPWAEPIDRLQNEARRTGTRLVVPDPGEVVSLNKDLSGTHDDGTFAGSQDRLE